MTGVHTKTDGSQHLDVQEVHRRADPHRHHARRLCHLDRRLHRGSDPSAGADPDNDGMKNLLEYVLTETHPFQIRRSCPIWWSPPRTLNSPSPAGRIRSVRHHPDLPIRHHLTGWTDIVGPGRQRKSSARPPVTVTDGLRRTPSPSLSRNPLPRAASSSAVSSHQTLMLDSRPPAPTFTGRSRAAYFLLIPVRKPSIVSQNP